MGHISLTVIINVFQIPQVPSSYLALLAGFLSVVVPGNPPISRVSVQQDSQTTQQPVFGVDVTLATISVGVLDGNGVPVTGLTAADFIVREEGQEREVGLTLTPSGAPLDIALVLDLSGSMARTPWRQRATGFLLSLNPRQDCVFLMGFSSGVGGSIWGRPNDSSMVDTINQTRTGGGTALYDAVVAATNELALASGVELAALFSADGIPFTETLETESSLAAPVRTGGCPVPFKTINVADPTKRRRRALIVVTDGDDSASKARISNVELSALTAGIPLFHVQVAGSTGGRRGMGRGRSRRASSSTDFSRAVTATGGATLLASADAYQQLLERLRGYYVVGYYVPKASRGTLSELTRHEVEVQLRDRDGDLAYPEIVYRPTVDFVRAKNELEIARQQFQTGDIDGTLFAVETALTANPDLGAAVAYRALVYDHLGRTNEALSDVTRATALSPTDIAIRRLAIRLHRKAGEFEIAFYHTMRIAQTGEDVFEMFGEIAADMPFPDDFLQQFEAPRIAVVPGDSEENNLFARAALPKAIRTIRQAIAEAPLLGLVADSSDAAFVVEVADRDIDQDAPRRFRGRIRLFDSNGKEIYEKGLTLDNVDAPNKDADDLKEIAKHVREILKEISDAKR